LPSASGLEFCKEIRKPDAQTPIHFRQSIRQQSAFFAAAGDARISAVDVRDLADVAVAALTTSQHDNKSYALTGPETLTFAEMAQKLSETVGRTITFIDVPPESMRTALAELGFPAWQADGLAAEFAMYQRGEISFLDSRIRYITDSTVATGFGLISRSTHSASVRDGSERAMYICTKVVFPKPGGPVMIMALRGFSET
jgi:hypothetical protein